MAILQTIKRRLLLGGRSRATTAEQAPQSPPPLPPAQPQQQQPASWSPQLQRAKHASPATPAAAMATPRRILLGTLPAELAALQQQFSALPAHRVPSKEQMQSRMVAAKSPKAAQAAPVAGGGAGKQASGLPPRPEKAAKQGAKRAQQQQGKQASAEGATAGAGPVSVTSDFGPTAVAVVAADASTASATAKQSSIDRLRQHQAHVAAVAAAAANQGQRFGRGLRHAQSSGAEQMSQQEGSWGGTQERSAAARMTPRVLGASAQQQQQQQGGGGGRAVGSAGANRAGSSRGSGDLRATPVSWAGLAAPPGSATRRGSDSKLAEMRAQRASGGGLGSAAAARSLGTPPVLQQPPPAAAAAVTKSPLPVQRPPRAQLPADMLSLRESASLVRSGQLTSRQQKQQPLSRRARSVQESASPAEEAANASSQYSMANMLSSSTTALPADAARELVRPPTQPAPSELSNGTKRLAALRRQRRSEWLSDFGSSGPGWKSSQDVEAPSTLTAIAESRPNSHCSSTADEAADGSPASAAVAALPETPADVSAACNESEIEAVPDAANAAVDQQLAALPAQQSDDDEQVPPRRPRGMTQAQIRQQEAWGSLAGLSLGEMLSQLPGEHQPRTEEVVEAAGRENVIACSNTSSPLLQASPKPSPPLGRWHGSPGLGGWQGRRRTVPPPAFVESLERLAALHRARSDSEQLDGGIQWRLPAGLRRSRSPARQDGSGTRNRLPPLPGSSHAVAWGDGRGDGSTAGQLHELRVRSGAGHLAKARRRGSQNHTVEGLQPQRAEGSLSNRTESLQPHAAEDHQIQMTEAVAELSPPQQLSAASEAAAPVHLESGSPSMPAALTPHVAVVPQPLSAIEALSPSARLVQQTADIAPTVPVSTAVAAQQPQAPQTEPQSQLVPAQQMQAQAAQWVSLQPQSQLQPRSQQYAGQQADGVQGGVQAPAQYHASQQAPTGWYAVPASQQIAGAAAGAAGWWQQQQAAAYAHSQGQYAAHVAAQQQQQLMLQRQQSQHLQRQHSQQLQRQQSLQQAQVGVERRKWQVPQGPGYVPVPVAVAPAAGAHIPGWSPQQAQQQAEHRQSAYWQLPAIGTGQRQSAYLAAQWQQQQQLQRQGSMPIQQQQLLQHQGSMHRYPSGSFSHPHLVPRHSGSMQPGQAFPGSSIPAGSGYNYPQAQELLASSRAVPVAVRR